MSHAVSEWSLIIHCFVIQQAESNELGVSTVVQGHDLRTGIVKDLEDAHWQLHHLCRSPPHTYTLTHTHPFQLSSCCSVHSRWVRFFFLSLSTLHSSTLLWQENIIDFKVKFRNDGALWQRRSNRVRLEVIAHMGVFSACLNEDRKSRQREKACGETSPERSSRSVTVDEQ